MTTEEHLKRIRARCVELLALAEKRTQGEWQSKPLKYGYHIIPAEIYCDRGATQSEFEQFGNALFIASCAGPAEAGWKATIAAIDHCLSMQGIELAFDGPEMIATETLASAILAAWSEELL